MTIWIAALVAMFLWWFSTGAILMVVQNADRSGPRARARVTILGFAAVIVGAIGFNWSMTQDTVTGVYTAFLSALAIWGWIELAFLTGQITGPNTRPCPPFTPMRDRFFLALGTVAYHEILLTAALLALGFLSWDAPNAFGFWTFAVLWAARISAKLNLFLGVPRIHADFLPKALAHLKSHFREARMNWFFPFSVSALTFAAACWLERLYVAQSFSDQVGFALLTVLTALAILEHWVMVLPIPDERLWRWMLPPELSASKTNENHTTKTGEHHGL